MARIASNLVSTNFRLFSDYYAIGGAGSVAFDELSLTNNPFISWRDKLRTDIATASLSGEIKVSDIFCWSLGSNEYGLGFILVDTDSSAGSPRPRSWLFITGLGLNNVSTPPLIHEYISGSTTEVEYYVQDAGDPIDAIDPGNNLGSEYGITVFYDPDFDRADGDSETSFDYEFDDTTEYTYTGGDGFVLTVEDPSTTASLKRMVNWDRDTSTGNALPGMFFPNIGTGGQTYSYFSTCLDNTRKTLTIFTTPDSSMAIRMVTQLGEGGRPGSGDTDAIKANLVNYAIEYNATTDLSYTTEQAIAFDAGGTRRYYDLSKTKTFTPENYKLRSGPDEGDLDWAIPEITNGSGSSGTKGNSHEQALVQVFPEGDFRKELAQAQMFDEDSPMLKCGEHYAFPWQKDITLPFAYNSGELQ